jgi:hypothetical protein
MSANASTVEIQIPKPPGTCPNRAGSSSNIALVKEGPICFGTYHVGRVCSEVFAGFLPSR